MPGEIPEPRLTIPEQAPPMTRRELLNRLVQDWPNDGHSGECSFLRALGKRAVYPECDCGFQAREGARAFLAQPEEAREAALETALRRFGPLMREGLHGRQICVYCEAGGETAEEIRHYTHCIQVAGAATLADTSPAALLAQEERAKKLAALLRESSGFDIFPEHVAGCPGAGHVAAGPENRDNCWTLCTDTRAALASPTQGDK